MASREAKDRRTGWQHWVDKERRREDRRRTEEIKKAPKSTRDSARGLSDRTKDSNTRTYVIEYPEPSDQLQRKPKKKQRR